MEKKRDNGQQGKAQHVNGAPALVLTASVLHFLEGGKKDKLKESLSKKRKKKMNQCLSEQVAFTAGSVFVFQVAQ